MINIGQFKDLLRCTSKDVYSMNEAELQRTFNSMAKFLLNKCVIIVGSKRYRMLEIEFYLFSKWHKDIIAYPRTNMTGGEWLFHKRGVDICFKSYCKKGGKKYRLSETDNNYTGMLSSKNQFGGILIRSIEEVDSNMKSIDNGVMYGPENCIDALFKVLGAFDDNRSLDQIAIIKESESDRMDKCCSTIRHIPVKDNMAKVLNILSDNYGINGDNIYAFEKEEWKWLLDKYSLCLNWRFFIEREGLFQKYNANPNRTKVKHVI